MARLDENIGARRWSDCRIPIEEAEQKVNLNRIIKKSWIGKESTDSGMLLMFCLDLRRVATWRIEDYGESLQVVMVLK